MSPWPWEVCHCGQDHPLVCREEEGGVWGRVFGAPPSPRAVGLCERWYDSRLVLRLQAHPVIRRAWTDRRGLEAERKEQGGCGSWTEPVLGARHGFVIFTSCLREAVLRVWSQGAWWSVGPALEHRFHHWQAPCPRANDLTPLCLAFLLCERGPPPRGHGLFR